VYLRELFVWFHPHSG